MRRILRLTLIGYCLAFAALARPALASGAPASKTPAGGVSVHAPVLPSLTPWLGKHGAPGRKAWRHAAHFSIPYEIDPEQNGPAPVATRVDAGYTAHALWLRFRAYDPHPQDIHAPYREHDDISNTADDYVGVFLSPFDDTQWAYELFCTAGGVEWDAFRLQNNEYSSWDTVWGCEASRTAYGYRVLMRIPFASIKFPHRDSPQKWGVMFFRNWPRTLRHQMLSRPIDYDSSCTLCSQALVRTATPIKVRRRNFQLIPAVTLLRTDSPNGTGGLKPGSPQIKGSLDARWILRPDLEWAATVDPNFSEVTPDVLQLSVNRQFALFYQENRPFFEQGTQVFNTPTLRQSADTFTPSGALVDTLAITDPRWASKLVGQVGENAIGVLATEDTATNIVLPGPEGSTLQSFDFATRDALVRYRHDVGASAFGLFASDRDGGGYHNGVYALDGAWQIDPSDALTLLASSSDTTYPGAVAGVFGIAPGTVRGTQWSVDFARTRRHYNFDLNALHIASGYRADLGYLPQVGYDQAALSGEYDFYAPDSKWWQNSGFGTLSNWTRATGSGPALDRKVKLYAFLHADLQTHIVLYATRERQFYLGRTFTLNQFEMDDTVQPAGWLKAEVDVVDGDGIDYIGVRKGGLLSVATTLDFATGRHLKFDIVDDYERLDLQGRRLFAANLFDLRLDWYFTPRLFVNTIAQGQDVHNDTALYTAPIASRTRTLATQWLIGYQANPWTVFYAGSSEGYQESGETRLLPVQRTYYLKASYYFQP